MNSRLKAARSEFRQVDGSYIDDPDGQIFERSPAGSAGLLTMVPGGNGPRLWLWDGLTDDQAAAVHEWAIEQLTLLTHRGVPVSRWRQNPDGEGVHIWY